MLTLCCLASATPPLAGTVLQTSATANYYSSDINAAIQAATSNILVSTVASAETFQINQNQHVIRGPNITSQLSHLLVNTGNTTSTYVFNIGAVTDACHPDVTLSSISLWLDQNNSGIIEPGETQINLGQSRAFQLAPGQSVNLIVKSKTPGNINQGIACYALNVTAESSGVSGSVMDIVELGNNAAITLTNTVVKQDHVIIPGSSTMSYRVLASNIGNESANGIALTPNSTPLFVDGVASSLIVLREVVPDGMQYVLGSLSASHANAIRLFRLPGDAPMRYRTAGDDASAIEVGVGFPIIPANSDFAMTFDMKVLSNATGSVLSMGLVDYYDGQQNQEQSSNIISTTVSNEKIGAALAAGSTTASLNAQGQLDGGELVGLSMRIKNYGAAPLYNVSVTDILEGSNTLFGSFNPSSTLTAGQYTIVPGSTSITQVIGGLTKAQFSADFTGQAAHSSMLSPGAVLDVNGELTLNFSVRFNSSDRPGVTTLYNSAAVQATTTPNGNQVIADQSTNGKDPDPTGTGAPDKSSVPTPISTLIPQMSLLKTADEPVLSGMPGVYNITYHLTVTNTGPVPIPFVHIADNLDCAFQMDAETGPVTSWHLVSAPVASNGILIPSTLFTGHATCDRAGQSNSDPVASYPTSIPVNLVDGTQPLLPGKTEQISFTVQIVLKPVEVGMTISLNNKAWAVGLSSNNVILAPTLFVAATSTNASTNVMSSQGIVYDSQTFEPVTKAIVTLQRLSCNDGPAKPIKPADLFGTNGFIFNADGTVSMMSEDNGAYAFFLVTPDLCQYKISVTPPPNSGLVWPSSVIPPQKGSDQQCGSIAGLAPSISDQQPTPYYLQFVAGATTNGIPACQVANNNLPLDPADSRGSLVLVKQSSKTSAELGDALDYTLTLTNTGGSNLSSIHLHDFLPAGFRYQAGSSRLNGTKMADPDSSDQVSLIYSLTSVTLAPSAHLTLTYRVRIGVGAIMQGDAVSRAQAIAVSGLTSLQSNTAKSVVHITGGVFSDDAFIFGKVMLRCQKEGRASPAIGVPGVRLFIEDGTGAVTDSEGKWSIYGIRAITHALKIDRTTLPPEAILELNDHRQSGASDSRFVDVKNGELDQANFYITNCENQKVIDEVRYRRAAFQGKKNEIPVSTALEFRVNTLSTNNNVNAGPASGASGGDGINNLNKVANADLPLISLPKGLHSSSTPSSSSSLTGSSTINELQALPSDTQRVQKDNAEPTHDGALTSNSSGKEMEAELLTLSNELDFIDIKDGDTLLGDQMNVRVKGMLGSHFLLKVNGKDIDVSRVGKRSSLPDKNMLGWEYIGINLTPGPNELLIQAQDEFGNQHGQKKIMVIVPGQVAQIKMEASSTARADGKTPLKVKVEIRDKEGILVAARTPVTLESDLGRWVGTDQNPLLVGGRTMIEGGKAEFELIPPDQPGEGRIAVVSGELSEHKSIAFLPDLRPLTGIGIIEGIVHLRHGAVLGSPRAGDQFEEELSHFSRGTDKNAAARAAFFLKGTIKGDYLLTASYDSDKQAQATLFRDIRPDQYYPVYGDSSTKVFDAQSTGRLYLRVDKNRSYLLYGDFTTATSAEVRQLSQVNRTLTGIRDEYRDRNLRLNSYLARDNSTQVILEIPANGTSGPYLLNAPGDIVTNSEVVQLIVRDKSQPAIILSTTTMTTINDYSIDPILKSILFTRPIASLDSNLDPQSIRITYQVSAGGPTFWVGGIDGQWKWNEHLQLGLIGAYDGNPVDMRRLEALTFLSKVDDFTSASGELVRTDTSMSQTGYAERVEVNHESPTLQYLLQLKHTGTTFDNPGAAIAAGQTIINEHSSTTLSDSMRFRTEVMYAKSEQNSAEQRSVSASIQTKVLSASTVEIGLHAGQQINSPNGNFEYGSVSSGANTTGGIPVASNNGAGLNTDSFVSVRSRFTTSVSALPQSQVYIEGEQALGDSERHLIAVGAHYQFNDKTRIYGRYELIDSLFGSSDITASTPRNLGLIGIDKAYSDATKTYDELRLNDTIDGRSAAAATGIRHTLTITDGWNATLGAEHTDELGNANGISGVRSTALTGNVDYLGKGEWKDRLRGSFTLEDREGDDARTLLNKVAVAYKIDDAWSVLSRFVLSDAISLTSGNLLQIRQQIGFAYRPLNNEDSENGETWNVLGRLEHNRSRNSNGAQGVDPVSGNLTALPEDTVTTIFSLNAHIQPDAKTEMMLRLAAKQSDYTASGINSKYAAKLLQGRYIHDLFRQWDLGIQAALMRGTGGVMQRSIGIECGYQILGNTWLSAGYNVLGFKDPDLTANNYTDRGFYFRLRLKFDEKSIGLRE